MKNNIYRSCVVLLGAVILSCVFAGCSGEEPLSGGRVIRMAVAADYPPYAYEYQGRLTGIDVELGEMIAREAGRELRIVNGDFSQLIELIQRREADMAICALAVTVERRRMVEFSDPYEFAGLTFLVRSGEGIHYLTDMRGQPGFRIGAENGSTGYGLISKYLKESGLPMQLISYVNNREALKGLLEKQNDAVILDPLVARCLQMEHPEEVDILHDQLNHEEFGVAVSPRDPQLLAAANRVIHRLWESGELERLQQKHMKQSLNGGERADVP